MIHTTRPAVASRTCPLITVRGSRLTAPPGALTSYSISQTISRYSPPKAVMSQVIRAATVMISLSAGFGQAATDVLSHADAWNAALASSSTRPARQPRQLYLPVTDGHRCRFTPSGTGRITAGHWHHGA